MAASCHDQFANRKYSDHSTGKLEECQKVCENTEHLESYQLDCQMYCKEYWSCLNPTTETPVEETFVTRQPSHKLLFTIIILLTVIVLILVIFILLLLCKKRLRLLVIKLCSADDHIVTQESNPTASSYLTASTVAVTQASDVDTQDTRSTRAIQRDYLMQLMPSGNEAQSLEPTNERANLLSKEMPVSHPQNMAHSVISSNNQMPEQEAVGPFNDTPATSGIAEYFPSAQGSALSLQPRSKTLTDSEMKRVTKRQPSSQPSDVSLKSLQSRDVILTNSGVLQSLANTSVVDVRPSQPEQVDKESLNDNTARKHVDEIDPSPAKASPYNTDGLLKLRTMPDFSRQSSDAGDAAAHSIAHGYMSLNNEVIGSPTDDFREEKEGQGEDLREMSYEGQELSLHSGLDRDAITWLSRQRRDQILQLADRKEWIISISFCIKYVEILIKSTQKANVEKIRVLEELGLSAIADRVKVFVIDEYKVDFSMKLEPGSALFGPQDGDINRPFLTCAIGFFVRCHGNVHLVTASHNQLNVGEKGSSHSFQIGTCKAVAYSSKPVTYDAALLSIDIPHLEAQNKVKDIAGKEHFLNIYGEYNTFLEGKTCTKYEESFSHKTGVVTCGEYYFRNNKETYHNCISVSTNSNNMEPINIDSESGKVVILSPDSGSTAVGIGMIIGRYSGLIRNESGALERRGGTLLAPLKRCLNQLESQPYCRGKKLQLEPPRINNQSFLSPGDSLSLRSDPVVQISPQPRRNLSTSPSPTLKSENSNKFSFV